MEFLVPQIWQNAGGNGNPQQNQPDHGDQNMNITNIIPLEEIPITMTMDILGVDNKSGWSIVIVDWLPDLPTEIGSAGQMDQGPKPCVWKISANANFMHELTYFTRDEINKWQHTNGRDDRLENGDPVPFKVSEIKMLYHAAECPENISVRCGACNWLGEKIEEMDCNFPDDETEENVYADVMEHEIMMDNWAHDEMLQFNIRAFNTGEYRQIILREAVGEQNDMLTDYENDEMDYDSEEW